MPKISRKYYRRVQKITNSVICTVQYENITPLRSIPSVVNNLENNDYQKENNNDQLSYKDL